MKKLALLMVIFLLVGCSSTKTADPTTPSEPPIVEKEAETIIPEGEVNQRGNSVGNIVSGGIVAQQGEWIYYCTYSDGRKLYKIRTDGTGRTKLNEDKSFFINVVGDWIYYCNSSDDDKLYKIRTDGTRKTKLNEDRSWSINVVGEWIYYQNSFDGDKLYKIRTDGTDCQEFN